MDAHLLSYKVGNMKLFFIVLISTVGCSLSVLMESARYEMVPNIFLSEFETNTLAVVPTHKMRNPKTGCLSLCSATPNCFLACYSGVLCKISSALVTPYWKPVASPSQSLYPLPGYSCFSSWNFNNDLTTKIVNTSVSSQISDVFDKSYANNGYYSDSHDTHFLSTSELNAWYQIDMGSAFSISRVIVKIRYSAKDPIARFENVEVRVGNSSDPGSFQSNAIFGYFNGPAVVAVGQFVIFEPTTPITGRYISLQQILTDYFLLAELKIVGK